jgi:hypothetical protein
MFQNEVIVLAHTAGAVDSTLHNEGMHVKAYIAII